MHMYSPTRQNNYLAPIKSINLGLLRERVPTITPPKMKIIVSATNT